LWGRGRGGEAPATAAGKASQPSSDDRRRKGGDPAGRRFPEVAAGHTLSDVGVRGRRSFGCRPRLPSRPAASRPHQGRIHDRSRPSVPHACSKSPCRLRVFERPALQFLREVTRFSLRVGLAHGKLRDSGERAGCACYRITISVSSKRGPMRTGIVQRAAAAGSAAYPRVYAAQSRWYRPMHHD
jgi:hypothetical protein